MKRCICLALLLALLLQAFCLVSCSSPDKSNTTDDPSVVIAYSENSASAIKLHDLIKQKTRESISIVKIENVGSSFAIVVDAEKSTPINVYGWKRETNAIYLDFFADKIDFEPMVVAFLEGITTAEDIKNIQTAYFEVSARDMSDGVASYIDEAAEKLKESICNAYTKYDSSNISGTIYYVSNSGNDENDGRSPETAWETPQRVNEASFNVGDAVLFERGGIYRGRITCSAGVTYGTYGEGQMPVMTVSQRNYADESLWELHDAEHNIWRLKQYVNDPAIIVINAHLYDIECYDELLPTRIWDNVIDSRDKTYEKLLNTEEDLVYYWGTEETNFVTFNENDPDYILYLKSEKPPYEYENIEIGEDFSVFGISGNQPVPDVTVDGFCIKYSGGGISSGIRLVENLTVKNCVCAWIGGGLWGGETRTNKATRLGNAIGTFGGCDGFYVYNNWTYQIYDTGISPQYHYSEGSSCMKNIEICDNLIENAYWGIELWLAPKGHAVKDPPVHNVDISGNNLRSIFNSWGTMYHENPEYGSMYCSGYSSENIENFNVHGNIFDRTFIEGHPEIKTRIFKLDLGGGNSKINYFDNILVQYEDQLIGDFDINGTSVNINATKSGINRLLGMAQKFHGMDLSKNIFYTLDR